MGAQAFKNSLGKLNSMSTGRGAPPKITFNMREIWQASAERFGAPYPFDEDIFELIDFGRLQTITFEGVSIIDYFRGLVGTGFIMQTLLYCWRKKDRTVI